MESSAATTSEFGMANVTFMEPRGHYTAREAGLLAGVSGTTIGQWARRGYIRASQADQPPYDYSYQDIAEAIVVHELLDAGVPHRKIKRATGALRDMHGNRWPLQAAELGTADGAVVALEHDTTWDIGDKVWQQQITPDNLHRVAGILRRGGWAARYLPDLKYVEVI
jgi:DNA-binding transcriptional MerR regulator